MSYADYFPFGWQMPGRNQQGDYRYAYQGQEKDPETGWEAFELRMYDGRVGRWMTTDPYSQYHSPYLAMGNNPISKIDPDGGFVPFGTIIGAAVGVGVALYTGESVLKGALSGAAAGAMFDAIIYTGGLAAAPLLASGSSFSAALVTGGSVLVAGAASGATGSIVEQGWGGGSINIDEVKRSALIGAAMAPLGYVARGVAGKVFGIARINRLNASSFGYSFDQRIRRLVAEDTDILKAIKLMTRKVKGTEYENQMYMLQRRYNALQKEIRQGVITREDANVQTNIIVRDLFNYLNDIK